MKEFLDEIGGRYIVQRVKQMINAVEADSVTKQELQAELDALDINIDLSSYATKEELTNALNNIDLSAYATKEYVTDAINNAQLGGDVSSIDLSIYAKKSDLDSKADTQHTHTMSDITDYTAPDLSSYAKKTEIPSLDGYATTEYVDNAIANVPSGGGGNVDLSNYYTKAETNALIPSLEGYATEEYVSTAINSIPATDLSNYYTKAETYSKTEVDTLVANSGGGGSSSGSGEVYSTEEIAIGKWIDGKTIYRKVISMDLPAVKSGQTHSAIAVVGNGTTPCNIMMLDWRAVSYAGLTGSDYDYPSRIIHGDGFKSAVVWTTKNNVSSLTQELCRDMLSVFHAGNPTSSYINCYYGSSFASRRCDFIIDYLKVETT